MPDSGDGFAPRYDANYYAHHCGSPYNRDVPGWGGFFDRIAQAIVAELAPASALDAGCAMGMLVESLRDRGVDAYGIDISEYAIGQIPPALRPYCSVGSISTPFERDYDLIVCIEVLEHMPPDEAEAALDNFAAHTDSIIFSSTPADYSEPTHVNVLPMDGWLELFARRGFFRDVDFDASVIASHALRLERRAATTVALARDYERWHWRHREELHALRQANLEAEERLGRLRDEIASREQEIADLRTQCERLVELDRELGLARRRADDAEAHLAASRARKIGCLLAALDALVARVAPPGTRRNRLLRRVLAGFRGG